MLTRIRQVVRRSLAFASATGLLLAGAAMPAFGDDNRWAFSAEFGFGVKHNNDGGLALWRGRFGDDRWGGCGFVLGGWTGDWRNQVVGLTCSRRIDAGWFRDRLLFAGVGMVDIEPSTIVNSSWAFEVHLRYQVSPRTALSFTHYSNAGTHDPNRGYNFFSVEFLL